MEKYFDSSKGKMFFKTTVETIEENDPGDKNYIRNSKYSNDHYAKGIFDITKNGQYWSLYSSNIISVPGNTLCKKHNQYTHNCVYEKLFNKINEKVIYNNINVFNPFKNMSIDSTTIFNKQCDEGTHQCGYDGKKKSLKFTQLMMLKAHH